jgi:hypothetical protein
VDFRRQPVKQLPQGNSSEQREKYKRIEGLERVEWLRPHDPGITKKLYPLAESEGPTSASEN